MVEHHVEPHVFVIIGATGDLTHRKLLPALYQLRDQGVLETHNTLIVGASLSAMGEEGFRLWAFEGLQHAGWCILPDTEKPEDGHRVPFSPEALDQL